MAEDILEELFYGKIAPWEDSPHNKKTARRLNHEMAELWSSIEKKADSETLELLEKYLVRRSDMSMLLQCDCFKAGFRLGVKFLLTALSEDNNQ